LSSSACGKLALAWVNSASPNPTANSERTTTPGVRFRIWIGACHSRCKNVPKNHLTPHDYTSQSTRLILRRTSIPYQTIPDGASITLWTPTPSRSTPDSGRHALNYHQLLFILNAFYPKNLRCELPNLVAPRLRGAIIVNLRHVIEFTPLPVAGTTFYHQPPNITLSKEAREAK